MRLGSRGLRLWYRLKLSCFDYLWTIDLSQIISGHVGAFVLTPTFTLMVFFFSSFVQNAQLRIYFTETSRRAWRGTKAKTKLLMSSSLFPFLRAFNMRIVQSPCFAHNILIRPNFDTKHSHYHYKYHFYLHFHIQYRTFNIIFSMSLACGRTDNNNNNELERTYNFQ